MSLVIVAALELALFQEVWFIVLSPPVTMAVLGLNLGIFFLAVRPKLLKSRILGMLLASIGANIGISVLGGFNNWKRGNSGGFRNAVENTLTVWADSFPDQESPKASFLRFLIAHSIAIEFILLDLLGIAMIFCGGWVEYCVRDPVETNAEQPSPP